MKRHKKGKALKESKRMKLRYKLRVREARKKMKTCKARKKMKEHTKQRHDSTQARKVCEHVKHVGT